jgi:beta-galactosidase
MKKLVSMALLWSLAIIPGRMAAQYHFDKPLYGAAYYSEYTPTDRLDTDIKMMKESGTTVVRIGESSWGLFEPSEGKFEFGWMDRIVDKLGKAGIKIIFGTPTYSIPVWMAKNYPEVLAEQTNGRRSYYGIRQNMDFYNAKYRFFCERIIRKLMEHYSKNSAIIGYQVDNELEARGVNNDDYFEGFKAYLKDKWHDDLPALNKAWGLNYWGMDVYNWDEFYKRDGVTCPSYKNEWERWNRKATADFLNWQVNIVNEYKRKDQFVTHCFMTAFHNIDQVEAFKQMQYPAINIYHEVQDKQDGQFIAYSGDFVRTVANGNYIVTETNAQAIGWDSKGQYPPYDGQLHQNVYAHLASGSNMVEYWHWGTLHYGQETYWGGLLGHDMEANRVFNEYTATAHELEKVGKELVNLKKTNKVAILYSHDSYYALQFMPFSSTDNYLVQRLHDALYRQNIETDIMPCDKMTDFSQYSMLVIPPLYVATDDLLAKIDAFVKNGGEVVMMFKSGFCNENSAVRPMKAPGPLRNACGFYYQEYSSIGDMNLKANELGVTQKAVSTWMEFLIPETAKPLAYINHPFFGKWPCITENSYGKGHLIYVATVPSNELLAKIVERSARRARVLPFDGKYCFPIIMRNGTNAKGRKIHYIFNYSSDDKEITYPFAKSFSLLDSKKLVENCIVKIPAWGVVVAEE